MKPITIDTGMVSNSIFWKNAVPIDASSKSNVAIPSESQSNLTAAASRTDVDTYSSTPLHQESDITSIKDLYSKNMIERWENAKEKYGDNSFELYSGAQHLIFNKKLQEMGFFDGMSEKEAGQFQSLLQEITTVMNCASQNTGTYIDDGTSGSRLYCYEGNLITMPEYDEAFYNTYSDEAKLDLESSTAALQAFSQKYLSGENKEEFDSLISDFHQYNSEYLETYQSFEEKMVMGSAKMHTNGLVSSWEAKDREIADISGMVSDKTGDYLNGMGSVSHTKEETDNYLRDIASLFKLLSQSGSNAANIWEKLEGKYSDYTTNNTNNKNFKDYVINRSENVFDHMKSYWSKLITD